MTFVTSLASQTAFQQAFASKIRFSRGSRLAVRMSKANEPKETSSGSDSYSVRFELLIQPRDTICMRFVLVNRLYAIRLRLACVHVLSVCHMSYLFVPNHPINGSQARRCMKYCAVARTEVVQPDLLLLARSALRRQCAIQFLTAASQCQRGTGARKTSTPSYGTIAPSGRLLARI